MEERGERPSKKEKDAIRKDSPGKVSESQEHKKSLKILALELDEPMDSAKPVFRSFRIIISFF